MNLSFLACVLRPFTKNGAEASPEQRVRITKACVNPTSEINMADPAVQMNRSIWSSLARYLRITQPHERTDTLTLDAFKLIAQREGVTVVPINLVSQSFSFSVNSTQPPIESSRVAKLSGNIIVEAVSLLVKDTRRNTEHQLRIIVVYSIRREWNPEAKKVIEELIGSLR